LQRWEGFRRLGLAEGGEGQQDEDEEMKDGARGQHLPGFHWVSSLLVVADGKNYSELVGVFLNVDKRECGRSNRQMKVCLVPWQAQAGYRWMR
jgi:hypothetical protein